MCRSHRPSLISSKRPQRAPWWLGKRRPEQAYRQQNRQADSGTRPRGGLPGAPYAPKKPPHCRNSEKATRGGFMKTLVVGAGALGGIIAARLLAGGASVSIATRNATAAEELKASGLRVIGIGGELSTEAGEVAPLAEYSVPGTFDLIVLATKAQDAMDVASSLLRLLAPRGTLLPIQNGGVPQMHIDRPEGRELFCRTYDEALTV